MLLIPVALAVAGLALLITGFVHDSISIVYMSIACAAASGVFVILLARVSRARATSLAIEGVPAAAPAWPSMTPSEAALDDAPAAGTTVSDEDSSQASEQAPSATPAVNGKTAAPKTAATKRTNTSKAAATKTAASRSTAVKTAPAKKVAAKRTAARNNTAAPTKSRAAAGKNTPAATKSTAAPSKNTAAPSKKAAPARKRAATRTVVKQNGSGSAVQASASVMAGESAVVGEAVLASEAS